MEDARFLFHPCMILPRWYKEGKQSDPNLKQQLSDKPFLRAQTVTVNEGASKDLVGTDLSIDTFMDDPSSILRPPPVALHSTQPKAPGNRILISAKSLVKNTIKLDGIAETMQALEEGARLLVQQSQEPGTIGADLSKGLDLDSIVDGTESDLKGEGRPRGVSLPHGWKSKAIKKSSKTIITGAASQTTKITASKATKATKMAMKTCKNATTDTASAATNSTTANGNGVRAAAKRTRTGDDDGSDGGDVEEVDLPKKMQRGAKSKSCEGRASRRQKGRSMDAPDQ